MPITVQVAAKKLTGVYFCAFHKTMLELKVRPNIDKRLAPSSLKAR